ncbi:reverse transcriptase domain-containing protein [Tanacetum coccineum]
MRMPNNVKTYDGTGDPEDHLKIFQAAARVERWVMPTWCHMFNSTLIGAARVWFDELPPESIDGYKGLKAAFLAYFMQQKYVKDPAEIHNIKQRDEETIKDFMERFKVETGRMKGAPECMRISGFMHGVNNPELTKRLNEHVPKTMEEMMTVTTAFIRGEAAAASKKKGHSPWKSQDQSKRHASERKSDFRGKFKPPPPMVTPVEKRSSNKFCDFHNDKGHSTDECMQLKKQIEELVRAGKLSHLIKEIKQGRDQTKNGKKEAPAKDKSLAIYMIQPWQRMTRQKLTQSFARGNEITFPPLANSDGTEGPLVIEAEIGGHMIHRMYIDGGSSTEVLYEHCFNQLRPEIKNQMVPATPRLQKLDEYSDVRSLSPYNDIIGRPGIQEIQAVPSTAHGMLKFPANGGIVTIRSTILIPAECTTVITSSKEVPKEAEVRPKNFKIALHPNLPDQEVAIGGTLSAEGWTELCSLLKKNLDIFVWQPSDMTGVP